MLCVSCRKLNQVISSFHFPIPHCNATVQEINTEGNYFITIDTENGYWQVVAEEEYQEILPFFTPDVKLHCKVIHMGELNAAPTCL